MTEALLWNILLGLTVSTSMLALGLSFWVFNKVNSLTTKDPAQTKQFIKIRKQLALYLTADRGMGQQLQLLDSAQLNLAERLTRIESRDNPLGSSHMHAIKLIELGASLEEIIQGCGLARSEAELLILLHKNKSQVS